MLSHSFTEILANAKPGGENIAYFISDNWLQGRTTYGGMSAALCLHAGTLLHAGLPPLRSAQINFVGPASGDVVAKSRILRRGKSVSFLEVELHGEKGLATHAVFCFGEARESRLAADFGVKPLPRKRVDCPSFHDPKKQPVFAAQFESLLVEGDHPVSSSDRNAVMLWIRHRDAAATDLVALIGVADMPPPAVLPMFRTFAPISSMNWSLNFLSESPVTEDRWWLFESVAEHARDGYSSQDMRIWNSSGELVVTARQNIAIFY
ncbi:MAG: thioesterase family protein [Pseudomonadales bacterium]